MPSILAIGAPDKPVLGLLGQSSDDFVVVAEWTAEAISSV
jgi:hypothetical protein